MSSYFLWLPFELTLRSPWRISWYIQVAQNADKIPGIFSVDTNSNRPENLGYKELFESFSF